MSTQLPYNRLVALYFALCAARKGTTSVVISNQHLKVYFIGNRKGERLSEKLLTDFANKLKPIFPKSGVPRGPSGPRLILYLNEELDQPLTKPAPVWFVDEATIRKTLGL